MMEPMEMVEECGCPFCGELHVFIHLNGVSQWSVICSVCKATGPWEKYKEAAIKSWEKRVKAA